MKKRILFTSLVLIVAQALFGCSGEDGATGPAGSSGAPGKPQPIKVLVTGPAIPSSGVEQALVSAGVFPTGTVIDTHVISTIVGMPALSAYDAVLLYRGGFFTPEQGDSLGDKLADFADGGGGVVIAQGVFTDGGLGGRIMTDAYSPLKIASASGVAGPRTIDVGSLDSPIHPIFNGTDFLNATFNIADFFSNPPLTTGATLLATDDQGHNFAAINAAGNVIGVNLFPDNEVANVPALQVLANCLLYVGGGI